MSAKADILTELKCVFTKIWNSLKENNIQNLKAKEFRIIISCYKKLHTTLEDHTEMHLQLSDLLLQMLTSRQLNWDCQIVASTAYCLTLTYLHDSETVLQKVLKIVSSTSNQSLAIESLTSVELNNIKNYDWFKICLCHGVLHCNNEFWCSPSNNLLINDLINNEMFPVIRKLCFEYSSLSLISFKALVNLIKKISSINQDGVKLSQANINEIMKIVMSNWENPLSGIREQNLLLFEQFLITNQEYSELLPANLSLPDITYHCPILYFILTEQSWMMKSKYFLLSAVLRICGVKKVLSVYGNDIITGLLISLKYTRLVSAGFDLYQVIASAFTLDEWKNTFLIPVTEALSQTSNKLLMENVISYWLPYTVKKYPLSLTYLLENISSEENNVNLFSYISLMKHARKEGCVVANWDNLQNSTLLIPGLLSHCDKIRSQAFYLLCVTSKVSISPSIEEIKLVKMFLYQNVNIDNSAMRQNVLNSFATFLVRLKESSLKEIKKQKPADDTRHPAVDKCLNFLEWLHEFLINNFHFDCNYQRKYTSLQMYSIILNYFCKPLNNYTPLQKKSEYSDIELIISVSGKANEKWKFTSIESQQILIRNIYDSTDDTRILSAEILVLYFRIEKSEIMYHKKLLQSALTFCNNPLFYEAESGALLLQTVLTLVSNSAPSVKEGVLQGAFGDCATVIDYLIKSVEEQFEDFSKDMLQAVLNGSPLYGVLDALEKLFSHNLNLEHKILLNNQIGRIIGLLQKIVSWLLNVLSAKSDTSSDFAPSFCEMGMAIASLVQQSSVIGDSLQNTQIIDCDVNESNLEDLQLTPAQQLVLNCIWHNLKVCCSISSKLISTTCLDVNNAKQCMDLLCLVLCKCRHKGAIESAGLAIYQATKFLTASDNIEFRDIPRVLLLQFLSSLVSANSTTISRRSAGLAILVHRIAAGDMQQGKPLLHICVSRFIKVFENFEEPTEPHLADLPQSQALHFLQTLVQDSTLRQEVAKYIIQISLLCFSNLGSSIWTLRNAALQLFGALLPKLTGQKKLQENETHNNCYHLAVEELYFHIKPLFDMIIRELSIARTTDSLQVHSRMMPILTLLSNLTVSFQNILNTQLSEICNLLSDLFQSLFKSEIYNVRKLSAKANSSFCLNSKILFCIQERIKEVICYVTKKNSKIKNNNELHGYLLNVKYLVSRFNEVKMGNNVLFSQDKILKIYLKELKVLTTSDIVNQHSLILNAMFDVMKESYNHSCLELNEITQLLTTAPVTSGIYYLADYNLQCLISNCDPESIKSILNSCIFKTNFDVQVTCLKALNNKIKTKWCNEYSDIIYILNGALHKSDYKSQVVELILEVMLEILCSSDISLSGINIDGVYFDILYNFKYGSKCSVVALPVICGIISKQLCQFSFIEKLCLEIFQRSNPIYNEEIRMNAAKSLLFIFPVTKNINGSCDSIGSYIWKSAVNLLQDEDKDIRLEASKFVFTYFSSDCDKWLIEEHKLTSLNLSSATKNVHHFAALEFIFKTTILKQFMSEKHAVLIMWEMLVVNETSVVKCIRKVPGDIFNPFCNDKNNIYEEESILIDMIKNSILSFLSTSNEEHFLKFKTIILEQTNFKELHQLTNTNDKGDIRFKKLQCQLQIVNCLVNKQNPQES